MGHKTVADIDAAGLIPDMQTEILMARWLFFYFIYFFSQRVSMPISGVMSWVFRSVIRDETKMSWHG